MALAYYDLRDDASGGFEDLVMEYGQNAFDQCMISPGASGPLGFAAVLMCVVENPSLSRRHTLDMRAAIVDAGPCLSGGTCVWSGSSLLGSNRVSRYVEGRGTPNGARQQLQYNRPNLPIFSKGRFPVHRRLHRHCRPELRHHRRRRLGLEHRPDVPTGRRRSFTSTWADNRNVGTPRAHRGTSPDWSRFTPPVLGPNSVVCVPGQVGTRNQDVYTAQLRPGLVLSSPQNSKRITGLQRSFVVVAHNTTDSERDYRLRAMPPAGVIASFNQFGGFGTGAPLDRDRRHHSAQVDRLAHAVCRAREPAGQSRRRARRAGAGAGGRGRGRHADRHLRPGVPEPGLREPRFREPRLRERGTAQPGFREPGFRESRLREPRLRELHAERELVDSQPRLRESRLREPRLREPGLRESRLREPRLRESRLRESRTSRTPTSRIRTSRTPTSRIPTSRTAASRSPTPPGRCATTATRRRPTRPTCSCRIRRTASSSSWPSARSSRDRPPCARPTARPRRRSTRKACRS